MKYNREPPVGRDGRARPPRQGRAAAVNETQQKCRGWFKAHLINYICHPGSFQHLTLSAYNSEVISGHMRKLN